MNPIEEDVYLMHYGMPRRSGRYPWGSGEDPYQHSGDFLSRVDELRKQNFTYTDKNGKVWTGDTAIAKSMGLTSGQFRTQVSLASNERRALQVDTVKALQKDGLGASEIGRKMGLNESTVRSLLNANSEARMLTAQKTAEFLKSQVDEKGMIDVGAGVELSDKLNVSKEKMNQALEILRLEGYNTYGGGVPQATNPGQQTVMKVLTPPGYEHKDIYKYDEIHSIDDYISRDDGETFEPAFVYPKSMDSSRILVRYRDDKGADGYTGLEKDGTIELRRGVQDLSLGNSTYAQVRILIDDKMFAKGMAVYSDDIPEGYDMVFNSNRKKGAPYLSDDPAVEGVFKKIKNDPDNPFGSAIKEHGGQSYYEDENGEKQLSLINKRATEGDWSDWSNKIPAQFLSKQSLDLAKRQLNLAKADKIEEYDEIMSLDNPTVKKKLLETFAEDCDTAAVHLNAAALPRQQYHVILPINSMKDTEVYAPNYENGEKVALIRYPHEGTFQIPILTVNNKNKSAIEVLGTNPGDAIGINSKVAEILSGADFDGDTVMVIPTRGNGKNLNVNITNKNPLKGLENFDPKVDYAYSPGIKLMNSHEKQKQMGIASNLITDMTLQGATNDELARAVKYSMTVIDAEKHKLDYKRCYVENGIASLKEKYQGRYDENGNYHEGAYTLISKARSDVNVSKRKGSAIIDPETGKQSWKLDEDRFYTDSKGNVKERTQRSTKMREADDAYDLVSDTRAPMELLYADYANSMKALANKARKEMVSTGKIKYSSDAAKEYAPEVSQLKADLNIALKNAPKERQAQMKANAALSSKIKSNPELKNNKAEQKKIGQKALSKARAELGAHRNLISITKSEWNAIQAGAVSENLLMQILNNADMKTVREYATPKKSTTQLSAAKISKIKSMQRSGYTTAEIANSMGISTSTVSKYLSGKE